MIRALLARYISSCRSYSGKMVHRLVAKSSRAALLLASVTRPLECPAWAAQGREEPLRDGGPARRRVFPRAAREGYLRARAASAPRPRDLDRRVRSRVCRARAGSRAGPRRYGACPRLARRRPQVELQVEVQPGLVRRVRQRPAPVGDQPPRVPRPSAPSPPPDRREFSLARRAPPAAVRRVRGFWSGGPPVPQGLLPGPAAFCMLVCYGR